MICMWNIVKIGQLDNFNLIELNICIIVLFAEWSTVTVELQE